MEKSAGPLYNVIGSMRRSAVILAVYFFAAFAYFHDAFTEGLLLAHGDGLNQYYPLVSFISGQYRGGDLPLWISYIFSGFPLMGASHFGVLYPLQIAPALVFPPHVAYNLNIVLHIALAGFFTFLYVREVGLGTFPSFFAGLVYGFTGYLIPHIQHIPVIFTAVWLPLVLYFFERIRARGDLRSMLFASLAVALQIYAGHPQVFFYTYIVLSIFVIYSAVKHERRARFVGLCALSVLIGQVISAPQLYATYELSSLGVRHEIEYRQFASYSLKFGSLPSMLFPALFGREEAYFALTAILLAAVALFKFLRGSFHVRFWGTVAFLTFVLALGGSIEPLHRLMYHVPLYNLFRGSVRHLVEFNLAVSVLSAFGVSFILDGKKAKEGMVALLVLASLVLGGLFLYFLLAEAARLSEPPVYITLAAVLAVAACLFVMRFKGKHGLFRYLVLIALAAEVLSFRVSDWPPAAVVESYVPEDVSFLDERYGRTAFLTKKTIPYLFFRYRVNVLTGYDPMIIDDFAKMLGMGGVGGVPLKWKRLVRNNLILSMLNTKFVFVPSSYKPEMDKIKVTKWEDGAWGRPVATNRKNPNYKQAYRLIHEEKEIALYENLNVMPRAYSVTGLAPRDNIMNVWAIFYSLEVNPREVATVTEKGFEEIRTSTMARGEVRVASLGHGRISLSTRFSGRGFVVLSDQYYPGWRAYIDGRETRIYKANGIMRGVVVPRGEHEVVFEYFPTRIYLLMALSTLTLAGIVITLIARRRA
jgi:hypothetical protein